MTDYLKKSFSVRVGDTDAYRDNYERIFGAKAPADGGLLMHGLSDDRQTTRCGLERDTSRWTTEPKNITCPGCK